MIEPTEVKVTNEPSTPTLIKIEGLFKQNAYTIEQWVTVTVELQECIEELQEHIGQLQEHIASSVAYIQEIKDAIEPHLCKGDSD